MAERSAAVVAIVCLLFLSVPSAEATEYIVDPSGAGHFTTVQEAVDVAHVGDTIRIRAGHYVENVFWSGKYLTLIGEGSATTILEAAVSGPTVRIEDMPNPTPSVFEDLTVMRHFDSTSAVAWNVGYVQFRYVDVIGWLVGGGWEEYDEAWVGVWDSTVTGVKMRGGWYAMCSEIDGSSVGEARFYGVPAFEWAYRSCLLSTSSEYGSVLLNNGSLHSQSDVIDELTCELDSACTAIGSELPAIAWETGLFDICDCHVAGDLVLSAWLPCSNNPGADPRVTNCLIDGDLSIEITDTGGNWCSVRLRHNTVLGHLTCDLQLEPYSWFSPYHVRSNIVLGDASLDVEGISLLVATHNDILGVLTANAPSDSVYGNISANPLFCGSLVNSYSLQECSPCADAGHDGESIGAYGVGCECEVAVHEASWGAIKAMFRQPSN